MGVSSAHADELTANVSVYNNYVWRGLTQTVNDAAVQGGIDYVSDTGFYAGTWLSNAKFAPGDEFSFEHDLYVGYGGEYRNFTYDVGYLYYNYDSGADFDFGEIYGSVGYEGFTVGLNVLTNTEANEGPTQDFGFGKSVYAYVDYGITIGNDIDVGFHVGFQDGDFNEAFNAVPGNYFDFNVSLAKGGFSFLISQTTLNRTRDDFGTNNDELRFVVGYTHEIDLTQ